MRVDRVAVGVAVACILGLTLATGPAGLLNIGTESSFEDPGSGTATVEVVSEPGTVAFERSASGQDTLHLSVLTTSVAVSNIAGDPLLSYQVALDEIGFATDKITPLDRSAEGEFDRRTFRSQEVASVTEAALTLTLRGDEQVRLGSSPSSDCEPGRLSRHACPVCPPGDSQYRGPQRPDSGVARQTTSIHKPHRTEQRTDDRAP
jgi:hypothetical protein